MHAINAFKLYFARQDTGTTFNAKEFVSDFCGPMKSVHSWELSIIKAFGETATGFQAFHRVLEGLRSEVGRTKVLACIRDNVPIGGSKQHPTGGLDEVRTVVTELEKMKAVLTPTSN